jgi:hypothetical protein
MLTRVFEKILLPSGGKLSPHYMKYMKWSFVSTTLVSIQTAMSTHSMLDVVGDSSCESYRTINYIGKDVIGQVSSLAYMSYMGEKSDKNSDNFMLFSNITQQLSFIAMSLTPMVSNSLFLPVAGTSNLLSNISFTGYGAINAKCIQEMSDDNTGELYMKITTVNTLASSIGLSIGIAFTFAVPEHEIRACLMPVIGAIRVYAYNKAIEDLIK